MALRTRLLDTQRVYNRGASTVRIGFVAILDSEVVAEGILLPMIPTPILRRLALRAYGAEIHVFLGTSWIP